MSMGVFVKPEVSYLTALLEQCRQNGLERGDIGYIQQLRDRGAAIVEELAIPTRRDEEWRFTDLSDLLQVKFQAADPQKIPQFNITPMILPEAIESRLVFVNGIYAPQHSAVRGLPPGVFVGNLAELPLEYHSALENYLAKQPGGSEVFTALNTAGLRDVAVVWLSEQTIVETPIHILLITTTEEVAIICQPRILVVAEAGSQLTLIEDYAANTAGCADIPVNSAYFTNQVTEIWLGENAQINHTRNQREAGNGFHIGKTAVTQASYSRYTSNAISLGAKLSRHNLAICQTGEGTETILNGLTMVSGKQLADTHSVVSLNHGHGISNQLHKCIIDDHAHAVFNGKVLVPQTAQFTNASQLNRNLLLSPKARVDTKPELEITADQVKCSHGATVSQLDPEEIFYFQSRGINPANARNLLIDAFVAEILNRIPVNSLHQRLSQCAICRTA